jgi:hypothetical protein
MSAAAPADTSGMDAADRDDRACGYPHSDARDLPIPAASHWWEADDMAPELTIDQTREILRLRRRHRNAQLVVHYKAWGLIIETRRQGHTIELTRFDWTGAVTPDRQIALAA